MEKDPKTKNLYNQTEKSTDSNQTEQVLNVVEKDSNIKSSEQKISDYKNDCELVKNNHDILGTNFDYDLIFDGRFEWANDDERTKKLIAELISKNKLSFDQIDGQISEARIENLKKVDAFKRYIDDFEGKLKHSRVNPFGPLSPVSPYQCVKKEKGENGIETRTVEISPSFIEQMKYLTERCPDTTIVVPFYNKEREDDEHSNTPESQVDIDDYVNICLELISKLGDGSGLTLEIGNETNVSHDTGQEFDGSAREQFASEANPYKYAKFYCEVASRIKDKYPNVKLSVSGTAFYDEAYLFKVLNTIKNKSGGRTNKLVDVISYHPYGDFNSDGTYSAVSVEGGKYIESNLDFEEQHKRMLELSKYFGVKLDIGEINFPSNDPNQNEKAKRFVSEAENKGSIIKLWPSASMPEASKNTN